MIGEGIVQSESNTAKKAVNTKEALYNLYKFQTPSSHRKT